MKLKSALVIFTVLTLGLFSAFAYALIRTSNLLDLEAKEIATAGESIHISQEVKTRLLAHNRDAFLFALHKDRAYADSRRRQTIEISNLLQALDRHTASVEEGALIEAVRMEVNSYIDLRSELRASGLPALDQYNRVIKELDEVMATIDKIIVLNQQQMNSLLERINAQNEMADQVAIFLLFLGCIILLGVINVLIYFVARPLTHLKNAMSRYGKGESMTLTHNAGLQEIGEISENFNSMADRLESRRQDQLRFIASIAHDLRNPLNSMSMASELMAGQEDSENSELSKIICRQVKNLDRLVGDLLDTTRIEAGELELSAAEYDLSSLIRDAVELHQMGSDIHRFKLDLPDQSLICICDNARISQVINNLLSNALKYSPNGGTVRVRAWQKEEQIWVAISDEGIGVDPEDLQNIFKPFHRTKATKETIPGVGLGLSASRRISEGHGGTLTVESTLGKGSTFYVTLPVFKSQADFSQQNEVREKSSISP